MSDPIFNQVRREIDRVRNAGGMRVGLPKVTIDASHIERLCDIAERLCEVAESATTPEEPHFVLWIAFDSSTDRRYIKKLVTDRSTSGMMAFFESEEEAKRFCEHHPNTDYRKVNLLKVAE